MRFDLGFPKSQTHLFMCSPVIRVFTGDRSAQIPHHFLIRPCTQLALTVYTKLSIHIWLQAPHPINSLHMLPRAGGRTP